MKYQDYYGILGVDRNATPDEIRKAFRRLARKYHPDVSKEAQAEARMKEVNEAYTVLSDPEKRAAYDRLGGAYHAGEEFRPPPGWSGDFSFTTHGFSPRETEEFSDFFSQLFGGMGEMGSMGGFSHRSGSARHARGEDHHAQVLLDIDDAYNGATRQLSLRLPQPDGHGRVHYATRTLNVKIPAGVREGQIIRLAGQGAPHLAGGPAGDLLLEVHFRPHERLRADGRDVHMTLPLAPWEAAMGAVIQTELPGSTLKVRIPEGAQSGQQLRVRGKGIPGPSPGDLLLNLQVVLPPADNPRARQIYETMARELAFDPRCGRRS